MNRVKWKRVLTIIAVIGLMFNQNCDQDIYYSPSPGILRVYLVTNPQDQYIYTGFDTLFVNETSRINLRISQMRAYTSDSTYVLLFKDLNGYRDEEVVYNMLEMDQGQYVPQRIVESYAPPNEYCKISFAVYPEEEASIGGLTFSIEVPEDYNPLVEIDTDFVIKEKEVYDLYIQFKAFDSIKRWRDSFIFSPQFVIQKSND